MILSSTSDLLRITTTDATATLDVYAAWADITTTTFTPGRTLTAAITGVVTDTTIVGSPGASTQRQIKAVSIENTHATLSQNVSLNIYDGSNSVRVYNATILAGASVVWKPETGWQPFNAAGTPVTIANSSPVDVQSFSVSGATGPWVKPTSFTPKFVQVILRGGGGGGGAGASLSTLAIKGGGGGGGGAAMAGGGLGGNGGLGGAGLVYVISW